MTTAMLLNILRRSQRSLQSQSAKPKCTKKARKGELTGGTPDPALWIAIPRLKSIHLGIQLHYQ